MFSVSLRESPALAITQRIAAFHPGQVLAVEPNIDKLPNTLSQIINLASMETAQSEADVSVLLVDHREFKTNNALKGGNALIIDTRGLID